MRGLIVLMALLLTAACSEAETTEPELPEGLSLTVMQYRSDEVNQVLAVHVTNRSADSVTIDGLQILAPGFDGVGKVDFGATIGQGRAFDLRLPYGEPDCGGSAEGELVVRATIGGQVVDVVTDEGAAELMRKIHDEVCAVERAETALPLAWATEWHRVGKGEAETARGRLRAGPVVSGPVELVGLEGTTLFSVTVDGLPRQLATGRATWLQATFRPSRCDGHALADSKKGFEFLVRLRLGEQEVLVPVLPGKEDQQYLLRYWLDRCDLGQ